jgi:hypothetical protein
VILPDGAGRLACPKTLLGTIAGMTIAAPVRARNFRRLIFVFIKAAILNHDASEEKTLFRPTLLSGHVRGLTAIARLSIRLAMAEIFNTTNLRHGAGHFGLSAN